jgi:FMN-dependent NADH-azoreductase
MEDNSVSNTVTKAFLASYLEKNKNDEIKTLDLTKDVLPPFTAKRVQAKFATWAEQPEPQGASEEWAITKTIIDEFLLADKYIFSVPMWNFGLPNHLKLYLDHIVQPWKTFNPTLQEDSGLVKGKPVVIIVASSSQLLGTDKDFVSSYLQAILGFIGFSDIKFIYTAGTSNRDQLANLINASSEEAKKLALNFEFDPNYKPKPLVTPPLKSLNYADRAPFAPGKKVLALVSSPMGKFSSTTSVTNAFLKEYKERFPGSTVTVIDLYNRNLPPFNASRVQAKYASFSGSKDESNQQWNLTKEIIKEFLWADTYVFAVPMWNLGIPNQLKLYFDHIIQPWQTFNPQTYAGLVTSKPCYLFCASGGGLLGTPYDFVTPYMELALGLIGFTDIRTVHMNGTANPDKVTEVISNALIKAKEILPPKPAEEIKASPSIEEQKDETSASGTAKKGKKLLVITSSPMGDYSASNKIVNALVEEYKKQYPDDTVETLDLSTKDLPQFTAQRVQAKFATWAGGKEPTGSLEAWSFTKKLAADFCSADKYVIAAPMWNLTIPNHLKLFIDHIAQPWLTFDPTKMPGGLVTGKPAIIVATSGGGILGTPYDYVVPYLKAMFGYLGFSDLNIVLANGTANQKELPNIIEKASAEAKSLVSKFNFNPSAKIDLQPIPEIPLSPDKFTLGEKVLAVVASPMAQFSASTNVLNGFLDSYKKKIPNATINILDIFNRQLPPFTAKRVQAKFASFGGGEPPKEAAEEWEVTKSLIEDFKWADTYVFAVPMWNLGIPNQLKLYFDHIVQPWKTFDPTKAAGGGLIKNKPCFLICASGASILGTPYDFTTTYMKAILSFIGFTDIKIININGTANPSLLSTLIKDSTEKAISFIDEAVVGFTAMSGIEKVLKNYEQALYDADVEKIKSLYFEEGASFLPHKQHPATGLDQIKERYQQLLASDSPKLRFVIEDIVEFQDIGYARVLAKGTINPNSSSYSTANREFLVLRKSSTDGEWKITNSVFNHASN